jgi:hypothetical protein
MSFTSTAIGAIQNALTSQANAARSQYDLAFQISPIILQGGIVSGVQGNLQPIINLPGLSSNSGEPFARFLPMPGSTLVNQSVGMYPFANQAVAANATIQQPLTISLAMIIPVNQHGGYLTKLSTFSALQQTLVSHNAAGGLYIIATPAYIYNAMIMTAMTDITPEISLEGDKQVQSQYQLDFIQPIVTQQQANAAQSSLIQKITNGSKFTGKPGWSGNQSSSPANLAGITGALGNVNNAVSTFGGTL